MSKHKDVIKRRRKGTNSNQVERLGETTTSSDFSAQNDRTKIKISNLPRHKPQQTDCKQ